MRALISLESTKQKKKSTNLDQEVTFLLGHLLPHVHHDVPELRPGDEPVPILETLHLNLVCH